MKSAVQDYIDTMIGVFPTYFPNEQERLTIAKSGIVPYLTLHIFSNRYRKSSPAPEFMTDVKRRIITQVKAGKPLRFTIPTGGYKKWQLESASSVNWAELFHLRFMLEYLAPILAIYEPGCILDYYSNDWLIKHISHYPQSDLDVYAASFRALVDLLQPSFPHNLKVRYKRTVDQLNEGELMRRILANRPKIEARWKALSEVDKQELLKYSERNIRWDILDKNGKLTPQQKYDYIYEGKIIHDSAMAGGWNSDLEYLRTDNAIPVIHRKSDPNFLHLATVPGSFVQFWVGVGILQRRGENFLPSVFSVNQLKSIENKLSSYSIRGIGLRNFETIEVLGE